MTCKNVAFAEVESGKRLVHLIRCTEELGGCCEGVVEGVGDCITADPNKASFLVTEGHAIFALTADWDHKPRPMVWGTTGQANVDVTVTVPTGEDTALTYTTTSNVYGEWKIDLSSAEGLPAPITDPDNPPEPEVLNTDALQAGETPNIMVSATVGSCEALSMVLPGEIDPLGSPC